MEDESVASSARRARAPVESIDVVINVGSQREKCVPIVLNRRRAHVVRLESRGEEWMGKTRR